MNHSRSRHPLLLACMAALLLGACDDEDGSDGAPVTRSHGNVTERLFAGTATENRDRATAGKPGGKLTVLSASDVDFLDPGKTYYAYTLGILTAVHRPLYSYAPDDARAPWPDLAAAPPRIAPDGRTVTVKLRRGVRFSRPVSREVTAGDVKYAIERAFTASVGNGYVGAYFGDLVGAPRTRGAYRPVRGIETPDSATLVFRLQRGTGAALAGALAMPVSIPVPKEFAARYDAQTPSTYGEGHAVYTGPYMIRGDGRGAVTGHVPGRRLELVRNPDYVRAGDKRPAYLDEIDIRAGNADVGVAARRVATGTSLAVGDIQPPANQLGWLLRHHRRQLSAVSGNGWRAIALDTSRPPFDDLDVRRAVIAGVDRVAIRQQRGGPALGPIAQHYIPPGMAGFEESGGLDGWRAFDWMRAPRGNRALAARYFRQAGHPSGRYEGSEELMIVADGSQPERAIAEIVSRQLESLGFATRLRLVSRDTMLTRFCGVPTAEVSVCPSFGWAQDFPDPQSVLDPTFNGANIIPSSSSNWSELDDRALNDLIETAKTTAASRARARAWAAVNRRVVELAPAIPYVWDYQSVLASRNVRGVQSGYSMTWDWSYTSLR